MKKGQHNKALSPKKTLAQNADVARWGRFAGTKALEALKAADFVGVLYRSLNLGTVVEVAQLNDPDLSVKLLRYQASSLQFFLDALEAQDAQFFRDLAGLVELKQELGVVSKAYHSALAIYAVWKREVLFGQRPEPTYAEMLEYLNQQNPDGINEQQLTRIVKATGMQLKRGKPGPKASKKKTAGKGRA